MLFLRITAHFMVFFLFLCLNRFVAGGCLNYGHSCWGGHGKRNGVSRQDEGFAPQSHTSDWYLTQLLQNRKDSLLPGQRDPIDLFGPESVIRGPESLGLNVISARGLRNKPRIVADGDSEENDGWSQESNDSDAELVVVSPGDPISPKVRLYQLLDDGILRKHAVG